MTSTVCAKLCLVTFHPISLIFSYKSKRMKKLILICFAFIIALTSFCQTEDKLLSIRTAPEAEVRETIGVNDDGFFIASFKKKKWFVEKYNKKTGAYVSSVEIDCFRFFSQPQFFLTKKNVVVLAEWYNSSNKAMELMWFSISSSTGKLVNEKIIDTKKTLVYNEYCNEKNMLIEQFPRKVAVSNMSKERKNDPMRLRSNFVLSEDSTLIVFYSFNVDSTKAVKFVKYGSVDPETLELKETSRIAVDLVIDAKYDTLFGGAYFKTDGTILLSGLFYNSDTSLHNGFFLFEIDASSSKIISKNKIFLDDGIDRILKTEKTKKRLNGSELWSGNEKEVFPAFEYLVVVKNNGIYYLVMEKKLIKIIESNSTTVIGADDRGRYKENLVGQTAKVTDQYTYAKDLLVVKLKKDNSFGWQAILPRYLSAYDINLKTQLNVYFSNNKLNFVYLDHPKNIDKLEDYDNMQLERNAALKGCNTIKVAVDLETGKLDKKKIINYGTKNSLFPKSGSIILDNKLLLYNEKNDSFYLFK